MDENNNNLDISQVSQLSFSEFDNSFFASTPTKKKVTRRSVPKTTKTKSTFAVPAPPSAFLFKCHICPKKWYKTARYFNQHMMVHKVQETYSKLPDFQSLLTNSPIICERVMKKINDLPTHGSTGKNYKDLVDTLNEKKDCVKWREFYESVSSYFAAAVSEKTFILPSSLWASLFEALERLSSNVTMRKSLAELILDSTSVLDFSIIHLFVCDFILFAAEAILSYIRETVVSSSKQPVVISFGLDVRQTIHYVGGSIIHAFQKRGKMFPKNKEWEQILRVIATKMHEGHPDVEPAADEDKAWTKDVNRGGLLVIGAKCMNMFLSVTAVVSTISEPNGTLLLEKVFNSIYDSPLPAIWDDLVGPGMLEEHVSLTFMNGVVKSYSQTWGRGLLIKKLNEIHEKPYASVNLRHLVAPKNTSR